MMGMIGRLVNAHPGEGRCVLWSGAYIFCLLCGYKMIRPIRDEISTVTDSGSLSILWTLVAVVMVILSPIYIALAGRSSRTRLIPWVNRFFGSHLVAFALLIAVLPAEGGAMVWLERVFYVWVSVFNLFVISVFWSCMADTFRTGQAKRLFGIIAVGGTLGAIVGDAFTAFFISPPESLFGVDTLFLSAVQIPKWGILLLAALLLEGSCWCVNQLNRCRPTLSANQLPPCDNNHTKRTTDADVPIGGSFVDGMRAVVRSPMLLGLCAYLVLHALSSSFLYYEQRELVRDAFADRNDRTAFFAQLDLVVDVCTISIQLFLTGRLIRWVGLSIALAVLPLVCVFGFFAFGMGPTLGVIFVFQVIRRCSNYALGKPAREVLYTTIPRADKYKAKNFIDTAIYRWGDTLSGWLYTFVESMGMGVSVIAIAIVPFMVGWGGIGLYLGSIHNRDRTRLAQDQTELQDP